MTASSAANAPVEDDDELDSDDNDERELSELRLEDGDDDDGDELDEMDEDDCDELDELNELDDELLAELGDEDEIDELDELFELDDPLEPELSELAELSDDSDDSDAATLLSCSYYLALTWSYSLNSDHCPGMRSKPVSLHHALCELRQFLYTIGIPWILYWTSASVVTYPGLHQPLHVSIDLVEVFSLAWIAAADVVQNSAFTLSHILGTGNLPLDDGNLFHRVHRL
jgi:hypothetical protein